MPYRINGQLSRAWVGQVIFSQFSSAKGAGKVQRSRSPKPEARSPKPEAGSQKPGPKPYSIPNCLWICSSGTPFVSGTMVFTQISCRTIMPAKNENT